MTAPKNRAASILAKLNNLHRETGKEHQYLIDRFTQERFLYRISTGPHRDRFVLKGGLLLTAMTDRFYRATRDIDVRAIAANDPEAVNILVVEAITHNVPDDGMVFRADAMRIEEIRTQGERRGRRVIIPATLGTVQARIQMDMGFDDLIVLPELEFDYPVLLEEYPSPKIQAYSRESIIAEKLEAIAALDEASTRLKDYDDVRELADHSRFYASALWLAITTTFAHRETPIDQLWPAMGADRAAVREQMYQAYRRRLDVQGGAQTFATCLARLREFIEPLRAYDGDGIQRIWENEQWTKL